MNYISGTTIRELRMGLKLTQKELGDRLGVSEKAVSKWETEKGLPDIMLLEPLARELRISVPELLCGELNINNNKSCNLTKSSFYVCPVCGNVIYSLGEGTYSCCGVQLPVLQEDIADNSHNISVEKLDGEYYVRINHEMNKEHYVSFIALVTVDSVQIKKFYPEQTAEGYFRINGRGKIYAYCNKHGLFSVKL